MIRMAMLSSEDETETDSECVKCFPLFSQFSKITEMDDSLDCELVLSLMGKRGLKVRDHQYDGYALLCQAVSRRRLDLARLLLAEGAAAVMPPASNLQLHYIMQDKHISSYFCKRVGPLHRAIEYGDIELLNMMLSRVDVLSDRDVCGNSALHTAVRFKRHEAAGALLRRGLRVDCGNASGSSPLMYAIESGNDELAMLELLCSHKADLNKPRHDRMNPLLLASCNNRLDTVRLLLDHGADMNAADVEGTTSLLLACRFGNYDVCHLLIDRGCDMRQVDDKGNNLLHLACVKGNYHMITSALDKGFAINCRNHDGETPLIVLHKQPQPSYDCSVSELLLERGADANACDRLGNTALLEAARAEAERAVTLLLQRGADPNMTDGRGMTALHVAARALDPAVFSTLLCYGADINVRCNRATTPLSAIRHKTSHSCNVIYDTAIKWRALGLVTVTDETLASLHPDAPSYFRQFQHKCESELSELRSLSRNLFLLLMNPTDGTDPLNPPYHNLSSIDEELVLGPESGTVLRFPLYRDIVWQQYGRAEIRFKLLQGCHSFSHWLQHRLPYLCVQRILYYLPNSDLKSLSNW